jgi:hypothetical protein
MTCPLGGIRKDIQHATSLVRPYAFPYTSISQIIHGATVHYRKSSSTPQANPHEPPSVTEPKATSPLVQAHPWCFAPSTRKGYQSPAGAGDGYPFRDYMVLLCGTAMLGLAYTEEHLPSVGSMLTPSHIFGRDTHPGYPRTPGRANTICVRFWLDDSRAGMTCPLGGIRRVFQHATGMIWPDASPLHTHIPHHPRSRRRRPSHIHALPWCCAIHPKRMPVARASG